MLFLIHGAYPYPLKSIFSYSVSSCIYTRWVAVAISYMHGWIIHTWFQSTLATSKDVPRQKRQHLALMQFCMALHCISFLFPFSLSYMYAKKNMRPTQSPTPPIYLASEIAHRAFASWELEPFLTNSLPLDLQAVLSRIPEESLLVFSFLVIRT